MLCHSWLWICAVPSWRSYGSDAVWITDVHGELVSCGFGLQITHVKLDFFVTEIVYSSRLWMPAITASQYHQSNNRTLASFLSHKSARINTPGETRVMLNLILILRHASNLHIVMIITFVLSNNNGNMILWCFSLSYLAGFDQCMVKAVSIKSAAAGTMQFS